MKGWRSKHLSYFLDHRSTFATNFLCFAFPMTRHHRLLRDTKGLSLCCSFIDWNVLVNAHDGPFNDYFGCLNTKIGKMFMALAFGYGIKSRLECSVIGKKRDHHLCPNWIKRRGSHMSTPLAKSWIILIDAISNHEVIRVLAVFLSRWSKIEGLKAKFYTVTTGHSDYPSAFHAGLMTRSAIKSSTQAAKQDIVICIGVVKWLASLWKKK